MAEPILEVIALNKRFQASTGIFQTKKTLDAVHDVSFCLYAGETWSLVGESGSGKTTTGRIIAGLTPSDSGRVLYRGVDLLSLSRKARRRFCADIQFVFQDPYSSLDPREPAGAMLEETLVIHGWGTREQRRARSLEMLEQVGLGAEHYDRLPHELSGGQRQRLSLARALIVKPKIVICDEPVSALDVSIQAQILNLLRRMRRELGLTLLFITHDLRVVRAISHRVGVMYRGSLVEEAPVDTLFTAPSHAYTKTLFAALPALPSEVFQV
jgi:oligopeptide transport system ATP-binding protein